MRSLKHQLLKYLKTTLSNKLLFFVEKCENLLSLLVEFPAVLLNTSSGEIESEFRHYVQPQEQPTLSAFCTELTGITQVSQ